VSYQDERRDLANEIARASENLMRAHEAGEHEGEMCMSERAGFVAFLAHRLGVRDPESMTLFFEALTEYELGHVDHDHNGHLH
jgi:hypothetical protein